MTRSRLSVVLLYAVSALALATLGCTKKSEPVAVAATSDLSAVPAASPDMQQVLDKLASMGGKPIESLEPGEARKQPTPADAVKAIMMERGMSTAPDPTVITKDVTYPAGKGMRRPASTRPPVPKANCRWCSTFMAAVG